MIASCCIIYVAVFNCVRSSHVSLLPRPLRATVQGVHSLRHPSAVGKGKILENGQLRRCDVRIGDEILFGKFSGTEVKVEGKEHVVMREEDVMAVIETK